MLETLCQSDGVWEKWSNAGVLFVQAMKQEDLKIEDEKNGK